MPTNLGAGRRGQGPQEVREADARGQNVVDGRGESLVRGRPADAQDIPQVLDLFECGQGADTFQLEEAEDRVMCCSGYSRPSKLSA